MLFGQGGVPGAFYTLPSFERPRWLPVELNDQHLPSHGKIGACELSNGEPSLISVVPPLTSSEITECIARLFDVFQC